VRIELDPADLSAIPHAVADRLRDELDERQRAKKFSWNEKEVAAMFNVSPYFLKEGRQQGYFESLSTKRPIPYAAEHIEQIKKWISER
jgi:hypothetical protein